MTAVSTYAPPLTARSVVLSLLLGTHEAGMAVRVLVDAGEMFGIAPSTMRVALSRLVAAGDLIAQDSIYYLSPRHLERQRAQDAALDVHVTAWDGTWDMVVIMATGRDATTRARLRADLGTFRFAELREGVWTRPANLDRSEPLPGGGDMQRFTVRPDDSPGLAAQLWDLAAWSRIGHELLEAVNVVGQSPERLSAAAALVRHLRTDPALPSELTPDDWPAEDMRSAYENFRTELIALRVINQAPEEKP